MKPHHHGREGHLALHTVLPDGINDASWEVDVEITEEYDAVRVLGIDMEGSADPLTRATRPSHSLGQSSGSSHLHD